MDLRKLIELVSEEFSGNAINLQSLYANLESSKIESYVASTALRLVKTFRMMHCGKASHFDFESVLRTFLIVTNSKICIPNYTLTSENRFGLNVDMDGNM